MEPKVRIAPTMELCQVVSSYRSHVLHCSIYIALSGYAFQSALSAQSQSLWGFVVLCSLPACLCLWALQHEVSYMIKRSRLPPGDSGYPIVGDFPNFAKNSTKFLTAGRKQYGPMWTFNNLMIPCVVLTDPEDVKWLSTKERQGTVGAFNLEVFQRLVGKDAIMFQVGREHRMLRKIFEPAFTPTAVRDYAETMDVTTQATLKKWAASSNFMSSKEWSMLALRIFFVCAFGEIDEVKLEQLCDLFKGWVKGFELTIPIEYPGGALHRGHKYKHRLERVLSDMVKEFKKKHPIDSDMARSSVLGRLCYSQDDDGKLPSDKVLLENLRSFLFAGFDTTKGTFGALSHYLTKHSDIRELLVEEVKSFREPLNAEELKNAPLLNAVLSETWRMAAPLSSHATRALGDIRYKGYVFPKGTMLWTDIQGYNADSSVFSNASDFRVARWLPPDHPLYDASLHKAKIDPNVMSPHFRTFNTGPHMCLGAHFAKQEVRIVVTRMLQRYDFEIRNEIVKRFPLFQMINELKLTEREQ